MNSEPNYLDELVRLQVLALRRSNDSQAETIVELDSAGFTQPRIADLLGTSPGTVKVAIQRAKRKSLAKSAPAKKES